MKEAQRGSHKLSLLSSPSPLYHSNYSNNTGYGSASEDAESMSEEILFGDEVPGDTTNQDSAEAAVASSSYRNRDWSGHGDLNAKNNNKHNNRRRSRSASVRESLLAEAWERKREMMMMQKKSWEESSMEGEDEEGGGGGEEEAGGNGPGSEGAEEEDRQEGGKYVDRVAGAVVRRRRGRRQRVVTAAAGGTRSLTDGDFEELRGCIDLGFSFDERSLPDLSDTLPALEVYCAVSRSLHNSPARSTSPVSPSSPSWRVASPGDDPDEIKDRLRHWAQAVACNVKLYQ